MRTCLAATFILAVTIGHASALDVGVGASVGGIGVGASVGVGRSGVSVGVDASVDGLGGAKAETSVGAGKASIDAGVGASVDSEKSGIGASSAPASGAKSSSGSKAARSSGNVDGDSAKSFSRSDLPRALAPNRNLPWTQNRSGATRWGYPQATLSAIVVKPGIPRGVVLACRKAVISAATPIGAVRVDAASAGSMRRLRRGGLEAPITVRIRYVRQGVVEVRQARTTCRLDAAGRVFALK